MAERCVECGALLKNAVCPSGHLDPRGALTVARPGATSTAEAVTEPAAELASYVGTGPTHVVADPLLPDVIGGFKLDFVAGTGGMGTVWHAHDVRLGTQVAVKVLKKDALADPRAIERSLREATAAARAQHPGVPPILGHGLLPDGRSWLAMPFYEGASLHQLLAERGPLPWALVVPALGELAAALGAAHAAGVIHRDVKPANVFLARNSDGSVTVKLLDFGLALLGEADGPVPQTTVQSVAGTAAYVAPEQALGRALDGRSDLYALGITAFQLLTGRLPFAAPTGTQVMRRQVLEIAPRLGDEVDVPARLSALVDQLLRKKPAERPATADEVRSRLLALHRPRAEGDGLLERLAAQWPRASVVERLLGWWK